MNEFISYDLPPLLAAIASSVSCALLGNYLVLRRMALMGDAISHAVLPGIVVAFLVTGSRASLPVFIGAIGAGLIAAILIDLTKRFGRVEPGAAMGVIFSVFFALGVLLIEQAAAKHVDLDADCLLHGQLESLFWYPPQPLTLSSFAQLPSEVFVSVATLGLVALSVVLFWKELKIVSFDPELSSSLGISAGLVHQLLMVLVAFAVVASFKVVGSILVIAMLVVPAATARLLTDRLTTQVWLSVVFALIATIGGYVLGAFGPFWFGFQNSLSAAGMIAVVSGALLGTAVLFAPLYGVVAQRLRRLRLGVQVAAEDVLAELFRVEETSKIRGMTTAQLLARAQSPRNATQAIALLRRDGSIRENNRALSLTDVGRRAARELIRTHRLWESYLVDQLGLRPDHVHDRASELEHFTSGKMAEELAAESPAQDPHGKPIPKKE